MALGQRYQAWVKESMTLFKREYAATMCIVFAMGAILGGFAFSSDTGIPRPEEGGHAADWLAAFGTLTVGYMAWRIASASHAHNAQTKAQQDQIEARRQYAEAKRFSAELVRVTAAASALRQHIEDVENGTEPEDWIGDLETVIRLVKDQALGYTILPLLDDDAIEMQDMLRIELVEFMDTVEKCKRFFESSDANNPPLKETRLKNLQKTCGSFSNSCMKFLSHVEALIDSLRTQL